MIVESEDLGSSHHVKTILRHADDCNGSVIVQYAVLGPYDFVTVIEAPDNSTAALLSVDLGSRGTVEIVTLPAVSIDDLEARIHHAEPMRSDRRADD